MSPTASGGNSNKTSLLLTRNTYRGVQQQKHKKFLLKDGLNGFQLKQNLYLSPILFLDQPLRHKVLPIRTLFRRLCPENNPTTYIRNYLCNASG
jgi:hypothetical protein